jgi:hypothetical protein
VVCCHVRVVEEMDLELDCVVSRRKTLRCAGRCDGDDRSMNRLAAARRDDVGCIVGSGVSIPFSVVALKWST